MLLAPTIAALVSTLILPPASSSKVPALMSGGVGALLIAPSVEILTTLVGRALKLDTNKTSPLLAVVLALIPVPLLPISSVPKVKPLAKPFVNLSLLIKRLFEGDSEPSFTTAIFRPAVKTVMANVPVPASIWLFASVAFSVSVIKLTDAVSELALYLARKLVPDKSTSLASNLTDAVFDETTTLRKSIFPLLALRNTFPASAVKAIRGFRFVPSISIPPGDKDSSSRLPSPEADTVLSTRKTPAEPLLSCTRPEPLFLAMTPEPLAKTSMPPFDVITISPFRLLVVSANGLVTALKIST